MSPAKRTALLKLIHLDDHLKVEVMADLEKFVAHLRSTGADAAFTNFISKSLSTMLCRGSGIPDNALLDVWDAILSEENAVRLVEAHASIPEDLRVFWIRMMMQGQILSLLEGMKSGLRDPKGVH
jgi:hypothetical protein